MLVWVLSAMYMVRMRSKGATAALDAIPAMPPASSLIHSPSQTQRQWPVGPRMFCKCCRVLLAPGNGASQRI